MKKTIVMVLMTLSGLSQAGDYMKAARNQKICNAAGELGVLANKGKAMGASLQKLTSKPIGAATALRDRIATEIYSADYSDEDARSFGWAACMDYMETMRDLPRPE